MGELKKLKNSSSLRAKSMALIGKDLKPERMNTTRWSSKHGMLRKEKALRPAIDAVDNWPPATQDLISTEDERELLESLVEALSLFESVDSLAMSHTF